MDIIQYLSIFKKELTYIFPIILSVVTGTILGLQRVHWGKSAGPRTYALVSAGATLFTLLSVSAFDGSTARVAAGVVTGIGFLGAGTILHRESRVEGLTTAAGLWMVAAIGMSFGVGYYLLGIVTALISLLVLMADDQNLVKAARKRKK